jgi:hypothetical protein
MPITNLLINGANPVNVGGTGTTLKIFPYVPGASIGVASTKNGYLYVPGNGEANAQRMSVRANGNFTIGGDTSSPNFTLGLYAATFVGNVATLVATPIFSQTFTGSGEGGATGTYYPWSLTADIVGDGLVAQQGQASQANFIGSGLVQLVSGSSCIDGTFASATAGLVTGLTSINFNAAIPFGLAVGVTFSQSGSGNSANMYQFDLSL